MSEAQLRDLHLIRQALLRKDCTDSIPDSLRARMVNSSTCPSCQVSRLIMDIRKVQQGLSMRGGIFVSKERAVGAIQGAGRVSGNQGKRHRIWIKKWRQTKIKIMRLLAEFEDLLGKINEDGEHVGEAEVKKAIGLWEGVEEEMCVVPGYPYVNGDGEGWKTEEDSVLSHSGSVVENIDSMGLQEAEEARKEKNVEECGLLLREEDESNVVQESDRMLPTSVVGIDSLEIRRRTKVRKAGIAENNQTADYTAVGNELRNYSNQVMNGEVANPKCSINDIPSAVKLKRITQDARGKKAPPRSALRSPNTPTQRASTTTCRNVTFLHTAHHLAHTDHPFPSYASPTEQPHNTYTTAETTRKRPTFHRRCESYTPGTWASPDDCEKVDTSLMRANWKDVESMWRVQNTLEETKTREGLQIRLWAWVFVWWVKRIIMRRKVKRGVVDVRNKIEECGL